MASIRFPDSNASGSVTVNLALGTATGADGSDTLTGIEDVQGGSYADTLTGNTGSNSLYGGKDNDSLTGGAGNDSLYGGKGNDVAIYAYAVTAYTIAYNDATSLFTITDKTTGISRDGADIVGEIESFVFGGTSMMAADLITIATAGQAATPGDDTLIGTAVAEQIDGLAGNDHITALAGADTLIGGLGSDTLIGGDGSDTYYVDAAGDVVTETNADLTPPEAQTGYLPASPTPWVPT